MVRGRNGVRYRFRPQGEGENVSDTEKRCLTPFPPPKSDLRDFRLRPAHTRNLSM